MYNRGMMSDRLDGGGAQLIPDGWQDDPSSAATFEAVLRRKAHRPEQRIMARMIEDAVDDVRKGPIGDARQYLGVRRWLNTEDADWPFNFATVCETVGVNAQAVRDRLNREIDAQELRGRARRIRLWVRDRRARFTVTSCAEALHIDRDEVAAVLASLLESGAVRVDGSGYESTQPAQALPVMLREANPLSGNRTGLTARIRAWAAMQPGDWRPGAALLACGGGDRRTLNRTLVDMATKGEIVRVKVGVYRAVRVEATAGNAA